MKTISSYNERLFTQHSLRSFIHNARFKWLNQILKELNFYHSSVVELGCFDAKTINFLPSIPKKYVGIDANWENGLDIAKREYPNYTFIESDVPNNLHLLDIFDFGICQETFEHIPPKDVLEYIYVMSRHINGYFIITVPNEIGIIFILKHIYKRMKGSNLYSFKEFIYEAVGQTEKVERQICGHKGFNYNLLISQLSEYFDILKIEGMPFKILPYYLNTTIGIVAKSKYYIK